MASNFGIDLHTEIGSHVDVDDDDHDDNDDTAATALDSNRLSQYSSFLRQTLSTLQASFYPKLWPL